MAKVKEVMKLYRSLHRTARAVFRGDQFALTAAHQRIRQEFEQNKNVENGDKISELIQYGKDCETVLQKQVLQLEKIDGKGDSYKLNVREGIVFGDNVPFRDDITKEQYRERNRASRKKCKDFES